jgi:hypothetical protein
VVHREVSEILALVVGVITIAGRLAVSEVESGPRLEGHPVRGE